MLYPIGIQSFETIRKEGYVYVDKTELLWRLVSTGKYYFLSRPRRFGKSLLVSTFEAYFQGRKELFDGLSISSHETEWIEYPVLRLDLSGASYSSPIVLEEKLDAFLDGCEQNYGVMSKGTVPSVRFESLIDSIYNKTKKPIVILIDEYDKPVLDNLGDDNAAEFHRDVLQGFYSVIKSKNDRIKFAFLTGVTKLGKMSVFSALNSPEDISMNLDEAHLCGITEEELRKYFSASVNAIANIKGIGEDECFNILAKMYDGYRFHPDSEGVYNPYSLLRSLKSREFGEYWFETGTPSFLVRFIQQGDYLLEEITSNGVSSSKLSGSNYEKPDAITLMYQTGYLTIKGYDGRFKLYYLDYPNEEVKDGFLQSLSQYYLPTMETRGEFSLLRFIKDVESGDVDSLMRRLTALFASSDYMVGGDLEATFENSLAVLFRLMGQQVTTEMHTSNGRIDVTIETSRFVYIMELKRDQDAEVALRQIDEKGYARPFLAKGKKIFKIGVNFSTATRCIDDWKIA